MLSARTSFAALTTEFAMQTRTLTLRAAVELFARNGTQTEPRLRTSDAYFKTLHSVRAGKNWKISSFLKLEIKAI